MPDMNCPLCQRLLRISPEFLGRTMRCPGCQQTFTAQAPVAPPAPEPIVDLTDDQFIDPPADPDPIIDLTEDQLVRSRADPAAEPPPAPPVPRRPPRRRRWEDEDDRYRFHRPHRGGLILTLGILGLVFFPAIVVSLALSITALCLANNDLREMAYGNMDTAGRGSTQGGKTCAIIGIVFTAIAFPVLCLLRLAIMGSHSHY